MIHLGGLALLLLHRSFLVQRANATAKPITNETLVCLPFQNTAPNSPELRVHAEPRPLSREELAAALARLHREGGGLELVCKVG